ncbi:MAG TPA: PEGA domain-containing protein [Terriglobales bacterium]|jgi:hypothetical protein|nr:PEGA domain-containing protein [Terriglobales bacterium]
MLRKVLALLLCSTVLAYADGNTFGKVRYNGGSISTTVKPDEWDNKLTVNSDAIVLALKDGQTISIPPKQVTSLSYGQEAHRRVGTAIGIAVLSLGAGALFMFHKTKLHYIGVNYTDKDGKKQGILLQGDKSNFRAIIVALQGVTGVPLSVGDKERDQVPAGVTVQTVKQPEEPKEPAQPAAPETTSAPVASTPAEVPESLAITSNPDGVEIYVDNSLVGNAPTTLKLAPGKHTITAKLAGYKDWSRDITAAASTEAHLTATMDRTN